MIRASRRRAWPVFAAALLLVASRGQAGGVPPQDEAGAHSDYVLYCAGCHKMDGSGDLRGRVPDLRAEIGRMAALPAGRAYLVQVPGVNNTGLDDSRIARVVNWLVHEFGGVYRPADFEPFTPAEVARLRAQRPVDIVAARRVLLRQMASAEAR